MDDKAFQVLGIDPTTDGRAIRSAFLRLARIYHPDRFVGQPDDVREEAERRMKEATVAYEALRGATQKAARSRPSIDDKELRERAKAYREVVEAKQAEEKRNRARWRRWQEIESQARERAELEAEIAASIARGDGGRLPVTPVQPETKTPKPSKAKTPESILSRRLDAARRGVTAPLARRETHDDENATG